jgi:hypothetical protein
MTALQRNELVATLRMLSLSNPTKWAILNNAADEIRRLETMHTASSVRCADCGRETRYHGHMLDKSSTPTRPDNNR